MAAQVSFALKSPEQEQLVRKVVEVTANVPDVELRGENAVRVLIEMLIDRWAPWSDPLAKARLRGALAQREILAGDGGALSAAEVAKEVGISRQAVDKRRKA